MNILIYSPEYATLALLEKMVESFKITQVHVLYEKLNSLFQYSKIKNLVTVEPISDQDDNYEPYEETERRSIYTIMNQISRPVFRDGHFVGFDILPTYMEGSNWDFYSNLELDHTNILVLIHGKYDKNKPQEYRYESHLNNFIRKYDNDNNSCLKHICIYELDPFFDVCTDNVVKDFNTLRNDIIYHSRFDRINKYMPLLMLHSLNLKSIEDFYKTYYSIDGFFERDIQQLKYEYENDPSNYDDSSNYDDTDYRNEMDYIRGNGGDWLFD